MQSLPNEILELILFCTDAQDLVRCFQVSQRFSDLISDSISLQYKIELALNGMVDGPSGGMNVSERLQALRTRKTAWASQQFAGTRTFTVSQYEWAFTGTHFAHLKLQTSLELEIIQIPCNISGITESSWTLPIAVSSEQIVQGFTIDGSQDLLVLIKGRRELEWTMEARSLATGYRHPDACYDSQILADTSEGVWISLILTGSGATVQFLADHVVIHVAVYRGEAISTKLIAYNWRTGVVLIVSNWILLYLLGHRFTYPL